jgi:predicted kinase
MKPILAVMVGISGSGKSTYAKGLKTAFMLENKLPTESVSTDDIRLEITGNAEDQTQNSRVFGIARTRVAAALAAGKNCIIDATSPTRRDRGEWIIIGKAQGAEVRAYFIKVSPEVAKMRNKKRERQVPEWVIDKQLNKLTPPSTDEGFDKVTTI